MDERVVRLKEWADGRKPGPYQIEIHPTNRCNHDCIMCGTMIHYRRIEQSNPEFRREMCSQWELPDKRMLELVDEAAEIGAKKWLITGGGEPMMRKELVLEMVKRIKKQGMFGNMNTNGTLFSEKDVEQFVKSGWDMLMFSIDSHNPETHDFIRGMNGSFRLANRTLNLFQFLKKKLGSERPLIVFNSVLTSRNYNQLDKLVEYAHNVGCSDITFIPLIGFPDIKSDLKLNEKELAEFESHKKRVSSVADRYGIHTNIESIKAEEIPDTAQMENIIREKSTNKESRNSNPFLSAPCFEPFLNIVIRMTGSVGPCCMVENKKLDVREQKLHEIWHSDYFRKLRENTLSGRIHADCSRCVYVQVVHNSEIREQLTYLLEP